MKIIVWIAAGCIVLSACKKKDISYTVEGTITDASFSSPLAGATVQLYEFPAGSSSPTDLLGTATTGADGKYTFTFKREKVEKYMIRISKAKYFPLDKEFSAEELSTTETNVFTHTTTAKAWVKLHFVNTDPDQNLKYVRQNGKSGCDECCTGGDQFLYGAVDESIYCINDGNSTYGYYYWVLNTTVNGPMSVVTPPFDTVELLLNY